MPYPGEPTKRKARVEHACYWCGQPIEKGTHYIGWSNVSEGRWQNTKVHCECNDAWNEGMKRDWSYYGEEVMAAEQKRGCLCSRWDEGECGCGEIKVSEVCK